MNKILAAWALERPGCPQPIGYGGSAYQPDVLLLPNKQRNNAIFCKK